MQVNSRTEALKDVYERLRPQVEPKTADSSRKFIKLLVSLNRKTLWLS